jgi:hypothetical protein
MGVSILLAHLPLIVRELRSKVFPHLFQELAERGKHEAITNLSLDEQVLRVLSASSWELDDPNYSLSFSGPQDPRYDPKAGRASRDFVCSATHMPSKAKIIIWANNKLDNLNSSSRNDITTYNNLLRLYLGIKESRVSASALSNEGVLSTISRRIKGEEEVAYGVFVIDHQWIGYNFFLFEELYSNYYYVNPRNTMFQTSYNPPLLSTPIDYKSFLARLLSTILNALRANKEKIEEEIEAISYLRDQINGKV